MQIIARIKGKKRNYYPQFWNNFMKTIEDPVSVWFPSKRRGNRDLPSHPLLRLCPPLKPSQWHEALVLTAGVGQFHRCQQCRVPSFSAPTTACSPVCRRAAAALLGFRVHWTDSDGARPSIGGKGFKGSELPAKASNVCSIQRHTMLSNIATSSQAEMIESYKNRTGDDFKRDSGSLLASGQDTFSLTSFVSSIWLSYF